MPTCPLQWQLSLLCTHPPRPAWDLTPCARDSSPCRNPTQLSPVSDGRHGSYPAHMDNILSLLELQWPRPACSPQTLTSCYVLVTEQPLTMTLKKSPDCNGFCVDRGNKIIKNKNHRLYISGFLCVNILDGKTANIEMIQLKILMIIK